MSDLNLFKLANGKVEQLVPETAPLEKQLQSLIEKNLYDLFGVRFLASEYSTSTGGEDGHPRNR